MKICVIVPSAKQLSAAGVRIRYQRIAGPLEAAGWRLQIVPMDDLRGVDLTSFDVCLFSKCQDVRSLILARQARSAGVRVGVDLFDDYFSQEDDPRFILQRNWLREMAGLAHFVLCSTPAMQAVARRYMPDGKSHVMADPYDTIDPVRLARELAAKTEKVRRERRATVLWFGISGNPNFPVGVSDLAAFAEALRPFSARGYRISLTVMTNIDGLDPDTLEALRRLPVPFAVREWSEEREVEALSRHFISFIPVNYQPFSMAKSLNRGISALTGGTQLLTAGHPLYRSLDRFAYHDANALIDDLEGGSLKLSEASAPEFASWMQDLADPVAEAGALMAFLSRVTPDEVDDALARQPLAVLNASQSTNAVNRFVQGRDVLTLGSPLTPGGTISCDAHLALFGNEDTLALIVSQSGLERLAPSVRESAVAPGEHVGTGGKWQIPLDVLDVRPPPGFARLLGHGRLAMAANAPAIMDFTRRFFAALYPGYRLIETELDPVTALATALHAPCDAATKMPDRQPA